MRWTFDLDAGAFYFYVSEGQADHQREIAPGVLVDVAIDGTAVGVEYLPGPLGLGDALTELQTLISEEGLRSIAFVLSLPPVPVAAQPSSRPAVTYRPVPSGDRSFELTLA